MGPKPMQAVNTPSKRARCATGESRYIKVVCITANPTPPRPLSSSNTAADAHDRLIFRTTDATLWFDRDGNGTKHQAILVADLNDGIALTAASVDVFSPTPIIF